MDKRKEGRRVSWKEGQTEERMNRRKEWVKRGTERDTKGQTEGRTGGWK